MSPHIYQHVPRAYQGALDAFVRPQDMTQVASECDYSLHHVRDRIAPAIRDALGLDCQQGSESWRIALTRVYYGIDPCWCEA